MPVTQTLYLYVKKHNKTGLRYLGKTSQDPFKYKGSGKRWKPHIKKHGYDVTTTVLLETQSEEELKKTGLFFSAFFDVVSSERWANLKEESGDGGPMPVYAREMLSEKYKGKKMSKDIKSKISKALSGRKQTKEHIRNAAEARKGWKHSEETKLQYSINRKGRPNTEEQKRKISDSMKGRPKSDETRRKISIAAKMRPPMSEDVKRKISETKRKRFEEKSKEIQCQ
jgi:superoxide dismutase